MLEIEGLKSAHVGPIDATVGDGECVAVMGASGTGKSLMLRAIVDLDVNEGKVSLNHQERSAMRADEWRALVALVPAESGWWADRVADHFMQPDTAAELVEKAGLPDCLDWEVSRLSTGERHRLALVRALETQPRVLLLDEPTAALDDDATKIIEAVFRQQLDAGVSILLVTHDPAQAVRLGDRSFMLEGGQLRESTGAPS